MSAWQPSELDKITPADDLHIAPFREDGATYSTPAWIWLVVVEDAFYVRAYNGRASTWYGTAQKQKAGRITVAGGTYDVSFEPVDGPINDRIDAVYRAKYANSPYLAPMVSARSRSATMRILPW